MHWDSRFAQFCEKWDPDRSTAASLVIDDANETCDPRTRPDNVGEDARAPRCVEAPIRARNTEVQFCKGNIVAFVILVSELRLSKIQRAPGERVNAISCSYL